MIAAGAVVAIVGREGRRECRVEDIVTGPKQTSLGKGDIVVSFLLPKRAPRSGDGYCASSRLPGMDIAVVGAGINLTFDAAGVCTTRA